MTKPKRKNTLITICVAALIIIAYICRLPFMDYFNSRVPGLVRTFNYIALYLFWAFSLRERIIQTQVRRYIMVIAFLMVFWFLVRTLKYHFVSDITHPHIVRYLWYLYYFPMLFIPLLAVFVALSAGKPESYCLPKKAMFLYIPVAALVLLVLTNDLHCLVFTFPEDAVVWADDNNGYGVGYFFVIACPILCALAILMIMPLKCRIPKNRKRIFLACIPIVILLAYMALYYSQQEWLRIVFGDMTAMICLMYAAAIEICIRCHFIQSNTHYPELFDASTLGAQITDEEYNVILSSKAAKSVEKDVMRQTENGAVMLPDGIRLAGAPIRGGHVVWSENISELLQVQNRLKEANEELQDSNGILEEENSVKAREAHIAEQDRLYNEIQRVTARQIQLMDKLIEQTEKSRSEEECKRLLKKMLVIGSYLKRRSNLVFLSAKYTVTGAKELDLTFRDSLENLELYGVVCGFCSKITGNILMSDITSVYDFFEEAVERSLDSMTVLTVFAEKAGENIALVLRTDSGADFTDIITDRISAERDDDGEWKLTFFAGGESVETP